MNISIFSDKHRLGAAAAAAAAAIIERTVKTQGQCRLLAATGKSQFEFLEALTAYRDLPWSRVEMFHLDEYVGIGPDHPASFQRYLRERLIEPTGLKRHHLIDGKRDPARVVADLGRQISSAPIDLAFAGIGENGHLAFNDPPADFTTEVPYLIVNLDEACRRQQTGEGWFRRLEDVPTEAISISIRQLLKARTILVCVPDARKAEAVERCLEGPVSPAAPASILREHRDVQIYLDPDSASRLRSGVAAVRADVSPVG